jgi:RHS repeat-associated protein
VLNDGTNADIMSSVTGRVLVAKSPESFTYDFDGNLTSDGLWTNIWNGENRHSVIESRPSVPAAARFREQWTFLPDGRWIERIVSTNNGSAYYPAYTNRYVWDGQVLLAVLDHTNGLEMSFLRGLDLSGSLQGAGGVGGLLAVTFKTGGTHFAAYDGNGNVAALVSAADGTTSAQYEYGPFGEALRQTGSMAKLNPIRFSTQFADDVTDVLKYLYRDFNPTTGRWLSRDPMEEKGGRNLYCFVANCPVNRVDALGLYEWGAWWDGFSGSLSGSWTSMGDALFDGLAGNSAVSSYYGVSVTAPDDMFENSAWGQSEAIGGATEVATKGCIGTAVIATVAVSYVGAAEFVAGYGGHGAVNMGIHATFRSNQRVVSTWAIRGALRWGARVANTGGTSSTFVRFTTTARYVIPVAASTGGRYLHGLPPEVKNYMLSVVRNIWTGRIVTVWIE